MIFLFCCCVGTQILAKVHPAKRVVQFCCTDTPEPEVLLTVGNGVVCAASAPLMRRGGSIGAEGVFWAGENNVPCMIEAQRYRSTWDSCSYRGSVIWAKY